MAQIPLRQELTQCVALTPVSPEQWRPPAGDPDLGAVLDAAGIDRPQPAVLALLQQAAGAHARETQIQEQAFGARRDLSQLNVNREMCERLGEVVALVQANNAGPSN